MIRATFATTLGILALSAAPVLATPGDGKVPEITTTTERQGWPHAPSQPELRRLAEFVSLDVAAYVGTEPTVARCKSFRVCRLAWAEGGRARVSLRVYEDGSYRVLAVLFPVTRNV